MFNNSKYTGIYDSIINRSVSRDTPDIYEAHHIIPKCLGGNNDKTNIANLTPREHFICHHLLTKMTDEFHSGLNFAFVMMSVCNRHHNRQYKITSSVYAYLKKCNSKASVIRNTGKPNTNKGRKRYHNPLTNESAFLKLTDDIPTGWMRGLPENIKKAVGVGNKGKVYYHHPDTKKVIALSQDESPPTGFIKGNPNADTSASAKIRGTSYYHSPTTGKEARYLPAEAPADWIKGRVIKWITDGVSNKHINIVTDIIPTDWKLGRCMGWKRNAPRISQAS